MKLRVFVSSVQKELEVERVAIAASVSADRLLGDFCEIVLYEKEPLSGRRVATPYLECLESCQIYLLLMDRQYSGGPAGALSATHEEYRHAVKRNMPVMVFVRGQRDKDKEREKETQKFFAEIKKDNNTYKRFHDRVDLLPEVTRGLERILEESFDIGIKRDAAKRAEEIGKASSFEQQVLNVAADALALDVGQQWLTAIKEIGEGENPAKPTLLNMLREKGLVRKEQKHGYQAMASGLLFLGKDPASMFPQCRVLADAYSGTEPDANPRDQDTLSSPAPTTVERVVDFVMQNTRHPIRVVGIRRVKLDEYPREVIREAIVNAIAHRDYEDAARPIYVKVFFDRVEILSPGDLLPPLTVNKLLKGRYEPCSRNPTLAQYLGHLRLMEQRGSGMRRMHDAMLDHGLDAPEYGLRDGYFTVVLRGPGDNIKQLRPGQQTAVVPASIEEQLTEKHKAILAEAAATGSVTRAWCMSNLGVGHDTASRLLRELVDLRLVVRRGGGRTTRYEPCTKGASDAD
ncbi:MAG: DUF4062 domain-containing protein [Kiritimatiellae bacterium]|nr:DUF4062 domain-containing protein [Kiritimatiellia bacterium]